MPFPMKIQPYDPGSVAAGLASDANQSVALKPLPQKSRLKRLLERQFRPAAPAVVAVTPPARLPERAAPPPSLGDARDKDNEVAAANTAANTLPEPSSLCLSKMVHNFLEGNNDKPARCGRRRCSCFNGNCDDSSDDDVESGPEYSSSSPSQLELSGIVRTLGSCTAVLERSLLSEVCTILERSSVKPDKDGGPRRKVVVEGLTALGYDAAVCKSRLDKTAALAAGSQEYEYIDVVLEASGAGVEERRVLIDIDFRSEFEIALSTKRYRAVLQSLPSVFVGTADRLQQIVAVVSEAARQSLRKRGLHVPPWRKPEYVKAKWLSPYQRIAPGETAVPTNLIRDANPRKDKMGTDEKGGGEVGDRKPDVTVTDGDKLLMTKPSGMGGTIHRGGVTDPEKRGTGTALAVNVAIEPQALEWQPPAVTPKAPTPRGVKVVTGLASIILSQEEGVNG